MMKTPRWWTELIELFERATGQNQPAQAKSDTTAWLRVAAGREQQLPSRLTHIGIDYGTSWSKLVFRDYEAPGGEKSVIVFADAKASGEFRVPSLVTTYNGRLWFGHEADRLRLASQATTYTSMKIRMAIPSAFRGRDTPLPDGFSADDLVVFSIVYLLQAAYRSIAAYAASERFAPRITFTVGVPMSDLDNAHLRSRFVQIAMTSSAMVRLAELPDLREGLLVDLASRLLQTAKQAATTGEEPDLRKWVRSEVEAALLWPFKAPETRPGLYAAVDVGAGTTSASFFYITGHSQQTPQLKTGLAFFGACCLPPGGDAIDELLATGAREDDIAAIRGRENEMISRLGQDKLEGVSKEIFKTYRQAFGRSYAKDKRQSAWEGYRLFLLGGGTEIQALRGVLSSRAWPNLHSDPPIMPLGLPADLDLTGIPADQVKFLLVAYGLSHINADIPCVAMPSDIPPFNPRPPKIVDMDRDNPDVFRPTFH